MLKLTRRKCEIMDLNFPSFLVRAFTLQVIEYDFSHTHALRRHLHILIFLDIFQTFLQTHHHFWNDTRLVIRT